MTVRFWRRKPAPTPAPTAQSCAGWLAVSMGQGFWEMSGVFMPAGTFDLAKPIADAFGYKMIRHVGGDTFDHFDILGWDYMESTGRGRSTWKPLLPGLNFVEVHAGAGGDPSGVWDRITGIKISGGGGGTGL